MKLPSGIVGRRIGGWNGRRPNYRSWDDKYRIKKLEYMARLKGESSHSVFLRNSSIIDNDSIEVLTRGKYILKLSIFIADF